MIVKFTQKMTGNRMALNADSIVGIYDRADHDGCVVELEGDGVEGINEKFDEAVEMWEIAKGGALVPDDDMQSWLDSMSVAFVLDTPSGPPKTHSDVVSLFPVPEEEDDD